MTEKLLHFIWKFQYFNQHDLHTESGEPIRIIRQGTHNHHQGPDFSNGAIQIAGIILYGNIELHCQTSDWLKHGHTQDEHYAGVILHVVWEDDLQDSNKVPLPLLVLHNRVAKLLLQRYSELMLESDQLHCKNFLPVLDNLNWVSWKERLALERLAAKAKCIRDSLESCNNHWEEVLWRLMAAGFGMKNNADFFERVAVSIPLSVLNKHRNQIHQLEAMILGQANLLSQAFTESYPIMLQKEYWFLKNKYSLQVLKGAPYFLRMRPASFPTIRLAQLAMMMHTSNHLFSLILETQDLGLIKVQLNVTCNDYWHYHYLLDRETGYRPKQAGKAMVSHLIINSIIPILFAHGSYYQNVQEKEKAIAWLTELEFENNAITRAWQSRGIRIEHALDSQALIQLTGHYCEPLRCLECAVGNRILKPTN